MEFHGFGRLWRSQFKLVLTNLKLIILLNWYSGGAIEVNVVNGNGKIWMTDVDCTVNDTDIRDCKFGSDGSRKWGKTNCGHEEDVGISCDAENTDNPAKGKNDINNEKSKTDGKTSYFRIYEPWHVIFNNVAFWQLKIQTRLCNLFLSLETPNDVRSVVKES